jgi:hypothetical protein
MAGTGRRRPRRAARLSPCPQTRLLPGCELPERCSILGLRKRLAERQESTELQHLRWQERLTALGIPHSGIKDHLITFRDPDNNQLEFFWQKPSA